MNDKRWPPISGTLVMLVVTLAVGCSKEPSGPLVSSPLSPTSVPTGTSSPTVTSTPTPTTTSTPPPTPIPISGLPVLAGTPRPQPQVPISADNVSQIAELALWGKGIAYRVVYSPDGRLLAVGTTIGVWLYDAQTLQPLRFINMGDGVSKLAFSPDSTIIFTKLYKTIVAWSVITGQRLSQLDVGPSGGATFFLQGVRLAAVPEDKQIVLWDMESGKRLHTLSGHMDIVSSLAFSPDGALLASGSDDQTVRLWDVRTGALVRTWKAHTTEVDSLAFSPDGRLLASGSLDGAVRLWEARTGHLMQTWPGNDWQVFYLSFSPDGKWLAAGRQDNTLHLWDVQTGTPVRTLEGLPRLTRGLAFSPDWTAVAAAGQLDSVVQLWNPQTGARLGILDGFNMGASGLAFLSDSLIVILHGQRNQVELTDVMTGQVIRTLDAPSSAHGLALSVDGTILAIAAGGAYAPVQIWIWDVATSQRLQTLRTDSTDPIESMVLSPDGKMLAFSTQSSGFTLIDVPTGKELRQFLAGNGCGLAFSPDGKKLVSVSSRVRLWNPETGELLHDSEPHGNPTTNGVIFSPDSKTFAVGYLDGTVRVWGAETGEILHTLVGHTMNAVSLAFSSDARLLVSGSMDGTARLWDAQTGQRLRVLHIPAGYILVAFSPDSRTLVVSSDLGMVQLWGVPPD